VLLTVDDHKFESRYTDEPRRAVSRGRGGVPGAVADPPSRAPDAPVILFQGTDDKVVPPARREMIADACGEPAFRTRGVLRG
jgi:alpha-beta hydrolase superfamily lysophospholipase